MHNSQKQEGQTDKRVGKSGEIAASPGNDGGISLAAQPDSVTVLVPERETRPAPQAQPRPETILVVEDEDAVRRIACTILRRHGYTVIDAPTPRRACEL